MAALERPLKRAGLEAIRQRATLRGKLLQLCLAIGRPMQRATSLGLRALQAAMAKRKQQLKEEPAAKVRRLNAELFEVLGCYRAILFAENLEGIESIYDLPGLQLPARTWF